MELVNKGVPVALRVVVDGELDVAQLEQVIAEEAGMEGFPLILPVKSQWEVKDK